MLRNWTNFVLDAVSALALLGLALTGLIMRYALPPGTGGRKGGLAVTLWGLTRHGWGGVHFWLAVAVGVLMILHVALHWRWVSTMLTRLVGGSGRTRRGVRSVVGLALIVLLIGLNVAFVAWTKTQTSTRVEDNDGERPGSDGSQHQAGEITQLGRYSLAELEAEFGVRPADLLAALNLPADTSPEERIGRLRQQHNLDMEQIREAVDRLRASAAPPGDG